MQKQAIFVIVILLIITGVGSYLLGSKLNDGKPRLIYVPTTNKAGSSSLSLPIKGTYNAGTTGKVKEIDGKKIIIEANKDEMTLGLTNKTIVFTQADNSEDKNTSSLSGIFKSEKKVTLSAIKTGDLVSVQMNVSQKQITANTIRILK